MEGTSGGHLVKLSAEGTPSSSGWFGNFSTSNVFWKACHRAGLLPTACSARSAAAGLVFSAGFYCKSVSPEWRGLSRSGKIGMERLQGTLFCKQWKQMVAGMPSTVVPIADAARWCREEALNKSKSLRHPRRTLLCIFQAVDFRCQQRWHQAGSLTLYFAVEEMRPAFLEMSTRMLCRILQLPDYSQDWTEVFRVISKVHYKERNLVPSTLCYKPKQSKSLTASVYVEYEYFVWGGNMKLLNHIGVFCNT